MMRNAARSLAASAALVIWLLPGAHGVGAQSLTGTTSAGLHYEVDGSGEPVVFIHAFSLDRRMWEPQVAAFRDRFQVVRYDLRGHGRSVPPEEPYTSHDDLRGLLDELGIQRATLVGLSAGAEVAINFAIVHPDRVQALVLAAPGVGGYAAPPLPWLSPVFEAAAAGDPERAARLWAETPIMALRANPDAGETVLSLVMENQRLWTYRRTEQPLAPPAIDRLAAVTCPVLVIVGDRDLPHILSIAGILEAQAGAAVMTIPGAGHIVNLDAPAAFNDAVGAFLEESDALSIRIRLGTRRTLGAWQHYPRVYREVLERPDPIRVVLRRYGLYEPDARG
jgi:3-oxoadipate enol-lactonase